MRTTVGTPGLERVHPLVPESRLHMVTFCGVAFLLDVGLLV